MSDEVDFLHANKHDSMIFDGDGKSFPNFPK